MRLLVPHNAQDGAECDENRLKLTGMIADIEARGSADRGGATAVAGRVQSDAAANRTIK
jgi:hypothetical protein